ncbi:uncharacterized protein LOC129873955 isoform X2 [Solanum dulcamara]|uniref:uncharacterized protein LOC129873955 isoform X2 n=1 Tax=Solanum dulcamara TaxID=45834 RepID=UPI0024856691|nr:uncharacterized protein LOC129873955 isoform X2 [Solanum dulcamara]
MSGVRKGPPKHQNKVAWKPNAGIKINETEVGGKFRPLSEITGVCLRCRDQIDWKRNQKCSKRNVRQAYHNLCNGCAKEHKVCAKCSCRVGQVVGRDVSEVEAEKKALEEAIKNARERDRRSLLRAMNKGKSQSSEKDPTQNDMKVGELFTASSLEEYAEVNRDDEDDGDDEDQVQVK